MGNLLLFSAREMRDDLQGRARSDWSEDGVTLEFVGDYLQEIIGAEVCVGDENAVASLTNRLMMFIESTIIRSSRNTRTLLCLQATMHC